MPLKYLFLQLRFRRIFASILLFFVGVTIGAINFIAGAVVCLLFLLGLLSYVLVVDKSYKRDEAE